jgi:hypothetical protein
MIELFVFCEEFISEAFGFCSRCEWQAEHDFGSLPEIYRSGGMPAATKATYSCAARRQSKTEEWKAMFHSCYWVNFSFLGSSHDESFQIESWAVYPGGSFAGGLRASLTGALFRKIHQPVSLGCRAPFLPETSHLAS